MFLTKFIEDSFNSLDSQVFLKGMLKAIENEDSEEGKLHILGMHIRNIISVTEIRNKYKIADTLLDLEKNSIAKILDIKDE